MEVKESWIIIPDFIEVDESKLVLNVNQDLAGKWKPLVKTDAGEWLSLVCNLRYLRQFVGKCWQKEWL